MCVKLKSKASSTKIIVTIVTISPGRHELNIVNSYDFAVALFRILGEVMWQLEIKEFIEQRKSY